MAPGAKPWSSSPVLPAATLLLLAVILMAKPATTIAAVDPAITGSNPATCSAASHLPGSCAKVLDKCSFISRLTGGTVDCTGDLGAKIAQLCCDDLFKMKEHECASCALLKEFDGAIDLTRSCTNGVNHAAADCKKRCEENPNDAECNFP